MSKPVLLMWERQLAPAHQSRQGRCHRGPIRHLTVHMHRIRQAQQKQVKRAPPAEPPPHCWEPGSNDLQLSTKQQRHWAPQERLPAAPAQRKLQPLSTARQTRAHCPIREKELPRASGRVSQRQWGQQQVQGTQPVTLIKHLHLLRLNQHLTLRKLSQTHRRPPHRVLTPQQLSWLCRPQGRHQPMTLGRLHLLQLLNSLRHKVAAPQLRMRMSAVIVSPLAMPRQQHLQYRLHKLLMGRMQAGALFKKAGRTRPWRSRLQLASRARLVLARTA